MLARRLVAKRQFLRDDHQERLLVVVRGDTRVLNGGRRDRGTEVPFLDHISGQRALSDQAFEEVTLATLLRLDDAGALYELDVAGAGLGDGVISNALHGVDDRGEVLSDVVLEQLRRLWGLVGHVVLSFC